MKGKQQLAIFDLDGTLIRGDSFRSLILGNMINRPMLAALVGLRATRIIARSEFAQKAHRELKPLLLQPDFMPGFLNSLEERIFLQVLDRAKKCKSNGQKTVLLSASPHEYVERVALKLGLDKGFGSDWRNGTYEHLYGQGKLDFAQREFPKEKFNWHYAISDSQSDKPLLDACNEQEYWSGN